MLSKYIVCPHGTGVTLRCHKGPRGGIRQKILFRAIDDYGSPKGTLEEKKVVRIAISFSRNTISFPRIIISRERNNVSRERNTISRERKYFEGTRYFEGTK